MSQLPVSPVTSQSPSVSSSPGPVSNSGSDAATGLKDAQGQNFGEMLTKKIKESSSATAVESDSPAGMADTAAISPAEFSMLIAMPLAPDSVAQAGYGAGIVAAGVMQAGEKPCLPASSSVELSALTATLPVASASIPAANEVGAKPIGGAVVSSSRADGRGKPAEKSDAAAQLSVDAAVLVASPLVAAVPAKIESGATKASVEVAADSIKMQSSRAGEIRLAAKTAGDGKILPEVASSERGFSSRLVAIEDVPVGKASAQLQSVDSPAFAQMSLSEGVGVGAFRRVDPPLAMVVAPRVGAAEWGGAVGERVLWMANQNSQVAELHLNPPNLGPLEVRLAISNDQASAMFVSHHAAVREAIEAALPRLREILADNGIMLGNATVGSESFGQQQQSFDQRAGGGGGRGHPEKGTEIAFVRMSGSGKSAGQAHDGMINTFA